MSPFSAATNDPQALSPEQGVTFSHIYKIDLAAGSSCKSEDLPTEGKTGPDSLEILFFNKKNIVQHITARLSDLVQVARIQLTTVKYQIILFLH